MLTPMPLSSLTLVRKSPRRSCFVLSHIVRPKKAINGSMQAHLIEQWLSHHFDLPPQHLPFFFCYSFDSSAAAFGSSLIKLVPRTLSSSSLSSYTTQSDIVMISTVHVLTKVLLQQSDYPLKGILSWKLSFLLVGWGYLRICLNCSHWASRTTLSVSRTPR